MSFDPSMAGGGWSGFPGVVTSSNGTTAGGFGPGATTGVGNDDSGSNQSFDTAGTGMSAGGGTGGKVAAVAFHPTSRQVLFFVAVVLLVFAWKWHLKSMLE